MLTLTSSFLLLSTIGFETALFLLAGLPTGLLDEDGYFLTSIALLSTYLFLPLVALGGSLFACLGTALRTTLLVALVSLFLLGAGALDLEIALVLLLLALGVAFLNLLSRITMLLLLLRTTGFLTFDTLLLFC